MLHTLENDFLHVKVESKGAELRSMFCKGEGLEYLWQRDPAYWADSAPVLFPFVGRLNNEEYRLDGKTYPMGIHGFAAQKEFELTFQSEDQLVFRLADSPETLAVYPFPFVLFVTFTIDKNVLKTEYIVENPSEMTMYFQVGGHPGFRCPVREGETFEDYCLEFDVDETASILNVTADEKKSKVELQRGLAPMLNNQKTLDLNYELFTCDTLVFYHANAKQGGGHLRSDSVTLRSKKSDGGLRVNWAGIPYCAFWTRGPGAGYVCIEPWHGIADYADFNGDLTEKPTMETLQGKGRFACSFTTEIL